MRRRCVPLLEKQGHTSTGRGEQLLHGVHLVIFATSTLASLIAWGPAASVLCYHFAWSACFSWLFAWLVGGSRLAHGAGYLIDAADGNTEAFICLARRHGPWLRAGAPAPSATVYVTVFTESFETILRPTIEQALRVVRRYNAVCGAQNSPPPARPPANLLVLDDGLQLVPAAEREARLSFYHRHGIAYVARPPDGAEGYVRQGFFKKAGNLNYVHALAALAAYADANASGGERAAEAEVEVESARAHAARCASEPIGPGAGRTGQCCAPGAAWCSLDPHHLAADSASAGGALPTRAQFGRGRCHGDVWLGEVVLLLDNDSFAPEEALLDSVALLCAEPAAAYVQHASAPLNPADSLVTRLHGVGSLIFWALTMRARAWAAPCPLLGHNVAIRRAALEAAGGYHTGRGADDLSTGIAIRRGSGSYGLLAKLHPWQHGFREGLPKSYRQLYAQWRRYGAVASGTLSNPLPDWPALGALQPDLGALLFLPRGRWPAAQPPPPHAPPAWRAAVAARTARAARVRWAEALDLLQFWLPGAQGACFFGVFLPAVQWSLAASALGPRGAPRLATGGWGSAWGWEGEWVPDWLAGPLALNGSNTLATAAASALAAAAAQQQQLNQTASTAATTATRADLRAEQLAAGLHLGLPIGLAISLALPLAASLALRLQADAPRLPLRAHARHVLLGAPLYISLWFAFAYGFSLDHLCKRARAYESTGTEAERALPVRAHLRAHRLQIAYGLCCVAIGSLALARAAAELRATALANLTIGLLLASAPFLLDPPAAPRLCELMARCTRVAPRDAGWPWTAAGLELRAPLARAPSAAEFAMASLDVRAELKRDDLKLRRSASGAQAAPAAPATWGPCGAAAWRGLCARVPERLPALDGVRALACVWVLGYHALGYWFCRSWDASAGAAVWTGAFSEWADAKPPAYLALLDSPLARLLASGSLGVDAFLVLSGFLIASMLSAARARASAPCERAWLSSGGWACGFLAQRALRLLPMHALALALSLCWPDQRAACAERWLAHLLLASNLRAHGMADGCVGQAWSVALEFQLYAASIPLVAWIVPLAVDAAAAEPAPRERDVARAAHHLWRATLAGGAAMCGVLACRALAPLLVPTDLDGALVAPPDLLLTQLPTRAGAYLCGLVAAFAHRHQLAADRAGRAGGAVARLTAARAGALAVGALALGLVALGPADAAGSIHAWNRARPLAHALTLVACRPLFGACVAYGLLHALHHRGSWLARVLEARAWVPLAAASYAAYMLQHAPLNIASQLASRSAGPLALRGVVGASAAAAAFVGFSAGLIGATLALAVAAHLLLERPALAWLRAVAASTGRELARANRNGGDAGGCCVGDPAGCDRMRGPGANSSRLPSPSGVVAV